MLKKKADGTPSELMDNEVVEIVVVDAETKAEGNENSPEELMKMHVGRYLIKKTKE